MRKFLALLFCLTTAASAQNTTPNIGLTLPNFGAPNWNLPINGNFSLIDSAIGLLQVPFQGNWASTTVYARGAQVLFNGSIFTSLINSNFNNQPSTSSTAWQFDQSASNFCSLSGCTLTGQLNGTSAVFSGSVQASSFSFGSEAANLFLAGPCTGASTVPVFRAICLQDLPTGIPNGNLATPSFVLNGQTATLGASLNLPFSTSGTNNSSIDGINFVPSSSNSTGLVATPSNPSGNSEKWEISGAYTSPIPASQISGSSMTINGQTLNLGGSATIPFFTDDTINISTGGINFVPSSANTTGLTVTPSNPAGDQEQYEIGGSYTLAIPYSQITGVPTLPSTIAEAAHEWLNSYNAGTGVFGQSQPTFADISGVAAASQIPFPSASSIGGVESVSPVANEFVTSISTAGVPSLGTVAYSGLTGLPTLAQTIAPVANEWLTGYTASTGLFTQSQPAFSNLAGSATAAQTPTALQLTGGTLTGALAGTSATFTGVVQGDMFTDTGLLNATYIGTNGSGSLVAAPQACQLKGCILTGPLDINSPATGSTETIEAFQPSLATGSSSIILAGTAASTNNSFGLVFNNIGGAGSATNVGQFGLFNDPAITISAAGALTVPSSLNASSVIDTGLVSSTFIGTSSTGQLITAALPTQPSTFAAVTNEFLTSYTSTTGLFTAAQPSFANLSGSATAAQTPTACQLTGCTLTGALTSTSTGAFTTLTAASSISGLTPTFAVTVNATPSTDEATFLQPSLATGSFNAILLGIANATDNAAQIAFQNVGGSGSTSNTAQFGVLNGSPLTVAANGSLTINAAQPGITINLSGTASGSGVNAFQSGLATGSFVQNVFGINSGVNNSAACQFLNNGGLDSIANTMACGLTGDPKITIGSTGSLNVPGTGTFTAASGNEVVNINSVASGSTATLNFDSGLWALATTATSNDLELSAEGTPVLLVTPDVADFSVGVQAGSVVTGIVTLNGLFQQNPQSTGGSCIMAVGATSCSFNISQDYSVPICIATPQTTTPVAGGVGCSVAGLTVTITSTVASATTSTWGAFVFGNPD